MKVKRFLKFLPIAIVFTLIAQVSTVQAIGISVNHTSMNAENRASGYTGMKKVSGVWYYYVNGSVATTYTGLVKYNSKWVYVKNGTLDATYTGLVKYNSKWVYVKNGTLDATYTGLVKYNSKWVYVEKGKLNASYTGLVKYNSKWVYVEKGKLNASYTGMVKYKSTWVYVKKGKLDTSYTGLAKNAYGWWHMNKGKLDLTYTGMSYNQNGWHYVENGKYTKSFTGFVEHKGQLIYVRSGKFDTEYNGTIKNGDVTYTIEAGVVVNQSKEIAVTGVSLNKTTMTMLIGSQEKLQATVLPNNASNKKVIWSSPDSSIVTVTEDGLVTAVGNGITIVVATTVDGEYAAACTVEVVTAVEDISLNYNKVDLNVGDTEYLVAEIYPVTASNITVIWSSSNTKVATVDAYGVVKAISNGTAIITGKTVDGGKTATCEVNVKIPYVPVTGVNISNSKSFVIDINTEANKTFQCTYKVVPNTATNKSVTWESSNPEVATVDENGKVTAVGLGSTTITVTTVDGSKQDTHMVYVYKTDANIRGGGNWWLKMKLANTSLYMTSANENTTSGTKVNVGADVGKDTQLWQFVDLLSSNGGVGFKPRANTGTYALAANTSSSELKAGSLVNLQQLGTDYNSSIFTIVKLWDDSYILKLKETNLAIGVESATEGTQLKFVEYNLWDNNQRWFVEGVQKIAPTSISLNKTSLSLYTKETVTLTATIEPSNATDKSVTWSSSDTSIATVNANGVVTAVGNGTATITVKTVDGAKTATCKVTVTTKATGVSITNKKDVTLDCNNSSNKYYQCTISVNPTNASNKNVTWSSDNTDVATVNDSGKITAVGIGEAIITVKTADGGFKDTIKVYVYKSNAVVPKYNENYWYRISIGSTTNRIIDVLDEKTYDGAKVQLWEMNGSAAQLWQFHDYKNENGGIAIVPKCNTGGFILDVNRGSSYTEPLKVGNLIDLWTIGEDNAASMWELVRTWDGGYIFRLINTNFVAGVTSNEKGTQLTLKNFDLFDMNQRWYLEGVEISSGGSTSSDPVTNKIASLRDKYVHGQYWNGYNGLDRTGTIICPCGTQTCYGNCSCSCGQFYTNGSSGTWVAGQCHGFALKMAYEVFGENANNWARHTDVNSIYAGDVIRINNDSHTVFVIKVEGDRIYYVDCNSTGRCQVNWDGYFTRNQLKSSVTYIAHKSGNTSYGN